MDRFNWIMKEIYKDGKKNFRWVIKGAGLLLAMILLIKLLIFFGMRDLFLPLLGILIPIAMLYSWYSMDYDNKHKKGSSAYDRASKRYMNKLKGGR